VWQDCQNLKTQNDYSRHKRIHKEDFLCQSPQSRDILFGYADTVAMVQQTIGQADTCMQLQSVLLEQSKAQIRACILAKDKQSSNHTRQPI
jgi:hypothetical protein